MSPLRVGEDNYRGGYPRPRASQAIGLLDKRVPIRRRQLGEPTSEKFLASASSAPPSSARSALTFLHVVHVREPGDSSGGHRDNEISRWIW